MVKTDEESGRRELHLGEDPDETLAAMSVQTRCLVDSRETLSGTSNQFASQTLHHEVRRGALTTGSARITEG